jgi:uncharacterized damage-inducible protein DinB
MLPPRIEEGFAKLPGETVDLCRPHPWEDLTRPPGVGMKSIRDVLVHMVGAEAYWIQHVVLGSPRQRLDPASFGDLDSILAAWAPQREATLALLRGLGPDRRLDRRPFPWNQDESASVEEIVWHVVTHEQYHRGQIFTRLALLGRRDLPDYDLLR